MDRSSKEKFHIEMPEGAAFILDTLHKEGYEAYIVGGCVRDSLLGRVPGDWDITTSARPDEVKSVFKRTVDTGIEHGTVTVLVGRDQYEVTTYRIDGEYLDGRHPENVQFTASLTEDMKRRDFTINAMAYSDETGIVDEFDGIGDIDKRMIRAVGEPENRFNEDALRIMRAVRFSAQLDYEIDPGTAAAAKKLVENLKKVSAERIRVELEKLLVSNHPERLMDAAELGITGIVLPEFDACLYCEQNNPYHLYTVGEHIMRSVCAVDNDKVLRLTMLLHDIGKPLCKTTDSNGRDHFHGHVEKSAEMADKILRRLKYDNDTRNKVVKLIRYHDLRPDSDPASIRKSIAQVGEDLYPMWIKVQKADEAAQSDYMKDMKDERIAYIERCYSKILENKDCLNLKNLAVKGSDLIQMGYKGPEIGRILNRMLDEVLKRPQNNEKKYLMDQLMIYGDKGPENS